MRKNVMLSLISGKYLKDKYLYVEKVKHCIYFITDEEYVKIGSASSVPNRIKQLQTGNARRLRVIGVIEADTQKEAATVEHELHKLFSEKRILGEWFCINEPEIKELCHRHGYDICKLMSKYDFEVDGITVV